MPSERLLDAALWARMQLIRWTDWRRFLRAARRPRETQQALLRDVLHRHRETRFGREHGFDRIDGYASFAAAVPVQTYESLRPYVEEQEATGRPALLPEPPVMYAQTSGTTGGRKLIPIPATAIRQHRRSQGLQSFAQYRVLPEAYAGRFLAIVSPAEEGRLETGTPFGSTSGFMYEHMPAAARTKYVLPSGVFGIEDYELKYRLILRLAVARADITHIACANPSTLVRLLTVLADDRRILLDDVRRGTFTGLDRLAPALRAQVTPRLACGSRRVERLVEVLGRPDPDFADLWPRLRLLSTWTGGSCRLALDRVRPALPPETRISDLGYLSSELRGTIVTDLRSPGGMPTIHETFFEFVDRDDWDRERSVFRTVDELEVGREYYVFPTTATGLYRYDMNDIVRVTGHLHATPLLAFVQKGKGVTSMTGEKLYESQVLEAVRRAGEEIGQPTAFFMMLADVETDVYRLHVEGVAGAVAALEPLAPIVERHLQRLNLEYAAKRASGRLRPVEVRPLRVGAGEAYKRHCLERGQREGQFKVVTLGYRADCAFEFEAWAATGTPAPAAAAEVGTRA